VDLCCRCSVGVYSQDARIINGFTHMQKICSSCGHKGAIVKQYITDFKMPFGKYKGIALKELYVKDPKYYEWCVNNMDGNVAGRMSEYLEIVAKEELKPNTRKILSFEMPFGKYEGMTLDEIASENYGYLEWCVNNLDDEDLVEKIEEFLAL